MQVGAEGDPGMHLAGALLLAPGHAPESWLGPELLAFQTVCEITSCGHVTLPSTLVGADGEAHYHHHNKSFLKAQEATEGSFITGPHTWAQVILMNKAVSFLVDSGPDSCKSLCLPIQN